MKIIVKTPTRSCRFKAIEINTDDKTYTEIKNFFIADVVVLNMQALENTKLTLDNLGYKQV